VSVIIGNVKDEQKVFLQESSTYSIIFGQPFITAPQMETNVINNGSAYTRIRSWDGRQTMQFLTVCANHKRNQDSLKTRPLPKVNGEFRDKYHDHMRNFHHLPL
jgi:hypothetical protein